MKEKSIIGVDMGGTNLNLGFVKNEKVLTHYSVDINANESEKYIVNQIINAIDYLFNDDVDGIGIGVPSLVDVQEGIVYDVQNIPSWKKVFLKKHLQDHFEVPVFVNNDANCFTVGEKYFGKGKSFQHFVGLTLGTGLGGGVIINDQLVSGPNCGVGEFGCLPYLDAIFESYCSGQFFKNIHGNDGRLFYEQALNNDSKALAVFDEFGAHLGNAILAVLYALDPQAIILGGSISKAFSFFKAAMWDKVQTFPYKNTLDRLVIDYSIQNNSAILGAAALYFDAQKLNTKNFAA
ncbi:ROK family protein [bacterium]|nr:ROK family protein [bacterium]